MQNSCKSYLIGKCLVKNKLGKIISNENASEKETIASSINKMIIP